MSALTVSDICIDSWDQLKADQAAVMLLWRDRLVRAIERERHEAVGFIKMMIVRFLIRKKKYYKSVTKEQLIDIADDLHFLHESWYQFHVTWLNTKHGRLYRPDERLLSFTFWQLIKADTEYSAFLVLNYQQSKDQEAYLDRLIAVIYQPEPGKFDDTATAERAKLLPKGLTFDLKYLILQTYSNIRKYIVNDRCPTLFPASTEPNTGPQHTGQMWQQMLFDLAETPAFSGLDKAKNARAYEALDYLEKKAIENQNRKK